MRKSRSEKKKQYLNAQKCTYSNSDNTSDTNNSTSISESSTSGTGSSNYTCNTDIMILTMIMKKNLVTANVIKEKKRLKIFQSK